MISWKENRNVALSAPLQVEENKPRCAYERRSRLQIVEITKTDRSSFPGSGLPSSHIFSLSYWMLRWNKSHVDIGKVYWWRYELETGASQRLIVTLGQTFVNTQKAE